MPPKPTELFKSPYDDDFARAERLGSGFCEVHVFRKIHVGTKQP